MNNTSKDTASPQESLERFLKAQEDTYPQALKEIQEGKKQTHWIWYIFPQLKGLGSSYNSTYYGIRDLDEARQYLNHPILGKRLREITQALLSWSQKFSARDILGDIDTLKVHSCMTLFDQVEPQGLFRKALECYFHGEEDKITLQRLYAHKNGQLLGAAAGDIIGSFYEWNPNKNTDFPIFYAMSRFTDDTVMTVAVANWLLTGEDLILSMQHYGRRYPNAGYGRNFHRWIQSSNPQPYNSFGNGSAMRVSPVGWAFDTLEETLRKAEESAVVSHNHPEGIKGAQAVAACIFLARHGKSKAKIKDYVVQTFGYDLNRTCDEIRPGYQFDVSCQGSVPESIIAFLESTDFESAVRLAISLGGDADTMGAISGSIAEAYYGKIPEPIHKMCIKRLPNDLLAVLTRFSEKYMH